jgi:hypothetical protein
MYKTKESAGNPAGIPSILTDASPMNLNRDKHKKKRILTGGGLLIQSAKFPTPAQTTHPDIKHPISESVGPGAAYTQPQPTNYYRTDEP